MDRKQLLIAALLFATPATASPILLASFDEHLVRPASAPALPMVEFRLETESAGTAAFLGVGRLWEAGQKGSIEFSEATDPAFAMFAQIATNGVDDVVRDGVIWHHPDGSGGTLAENLESLLYKGNPDLIGYHLQSIRLTVHDVAFGPYVFPSGRDGLYVDYHLTYEFYGTPIPEPTTGGLMFVCSLVLMVFCPTFGTRRGIGSIREPIV